MTNPYMPVSSPLLGRSLFARAPLPCASEEQENRERILLAAAALFADKGYAGTSVREIVEAAGVTKPTLYYYFKNKEDLYIHLMDLAVETFCWVLTQSVKRPGDVRDQLAGLLADLHALFRENLDLLRLVSSMFFGPKGAAPPYDFHRIDEHFDRVILEKLDAQIQQGQLLEANRPLVLLLLGGFVQAMSYVLVWEPQKADFTLRDFRQIIDILFDGARHAHPVPSDGAQS